MLLFDGLHRVKTRGARTCFRRLILNAVLVAAFGLLGSLAVLTLLARPVLAFLTDTAAQVYDPAAYISAILPQLGETQQ